MVSIIIPVFNGEKFISDAIRSVLNQTYKNIEIIVIDDGSIDKTADIVKNFDKIRYIYQNNKGPAASRNLGMALSKGEYIAFLDADDLYEPEKIQKQMEILEKYKEIDVVYNDMKLVDENLQFIKYINSDYVIEDGKSFLAMLLFRQIVPIPPSIMMRRKCYDEGIKYDEKLIHAEDYEFIIRLGEKHQFKYLQEPLYIYRRHEENLTNKHESQVKAEINIVKSLGIEKIKNIVKDSDFNYYNKNMLLAKIYIKIEEFKLSKEILINLSEHYNDKFIWFYLGNCFYNEDEYEKASDCYKKALEIDMDMVEAHNNLGCAYALSDKLLAKHMFQKALKIKSEYMDAVFNVNQINCGRNEFKSTKRELRRVLMEYR
ncbi:glycosyltransferase [Clostridium sp. BSD9I1]|uniref:glycosyltransferase n=1 Tax=Clostridium sp. BSD9I1 TaxID=2003589 RepID=UPI001646DFF1|nr:glycosyltransferase [Clostridium sp. BSD9I1]